MKTVESSVLFYYSHVTEYHAQWGPQYIDCTNSKYKVPTDGVLSIADQKKLDVCVQMVVCTCLHML